ncbi:MAG: hypothetical protein KF758_12705 [Anaerolineales bacterium]|nr:hypothetical protein [Anaerolineales bacterium]MBX3037762.1 hypothetical protein [Anaerolineales bacterium]
MNNPIFILAVLFLIAIALDIFIVSRWRLYKRKLKENPANKKDLLWQVFIGEPLNFWKHSSASRFNLHLYLEAGVLALWAIYIGLEYLDFDPTKIPLGRELGSSIPANHLWNQIQKCGLCAMWNGFQRGGFPAFADIQGSMLHPVVIITTVLFGVVNGVKVTIVVSLWLAGMAQWWIARELNLSWLPRMWSAGIAIAGGHLAGRMDLGVYGVVLSTAACSLAIAALIRLAKENTKRNAILLGIFTASAAVSGQGYMQIGLLAIFIVFALFYWGKENVKAIWKNYFVAAGIALLLAAPFLVPFLHFSPNISKWMDANFISAQPLSYFVLNLVIDDIRYFYSDVMGKFPYPYLYTLYIGWIPVLLFVFGLTRIKDGDKKLFYFMLACIVVEFLIASAILLKWLTGLAPFLAGVRHPPQIAGLAIPFILGFAAYGLEKIISIKPIFKLSTRWLVIIPLLYSLYTCMEFAIHWTGTIKLRQDLFSTLETLQTSDLQWVNPPFGEHAYVEAAIAQGLKLSPGILTWSWEHRSPPQPFLTADRRNPIDENSDLIEKVSNIRYTKRPENMYASIKTDNQIIKCEATGSGGQIQVACDSNQEGVLQIQEYMWKGWYAWIDENPTELIGEQYLEVHAPAGKHTFTFSYLPWDVPLGIGLFFIGIFVSVWFWFSKEKQ